MVFLEQLRDAASNTLRLPKFTLKPRKPKDDKDKDAKRPHSNDDAEPTAKKKKLPKRPDVMYLRDPKKKREEQAPKMKQKGRGPYKSHQEMTRSRSGV
ncbi:unnamed protein product [Heligmosomoides polygyrus]|uniref:BUD22 domain-containing protein n=1 Tax=Heligmosomoides polygyrus TaxID=6339 RepID=A0A183GII7_HELPZ|nr:unnamed protein product [Heligmosomoides polygyrus]